MTHRTKAMNTRALAVLGLGSLLLAAPACSPAGDSLMLSVTADAPVAQYDLYLWDAKTYERLLHTGWTIVPEGKDVTRAALKIGLKLPSLPGGEKGDYGILIVGSSGEVTGDVPADGVGQLFWADRVQVKGNTSLSARLLSVPAGDDADRDLWPDASEWLRHSSEAAAGYGGKAVLLDCNDKTDLPDQQLTAGIIHPFIKDRCGDGVDQDCDGIDPECVDTDGDGEVDETDCAPEDATRHHPVTNVDPSDARYDPFPQSANCCGYSLGWTDKATQPEYYEKFGAPLCHAGTCSNGIDEDCSGADVACRYDNDCDDYEAIAGQPESCPVPYGSPTEDKDCDDCDPTIHQDAMETCDGKDNNCDGFVDEGCVPCDLDGDGFERDGTVDVREAEACRDPDDGEVCATGYCASIGKCPNCPTAGYKAGPRASLLDCSDKDRGVFPGSTSNQYEVPKLPLGKRTCNDKEGGTPACAMRGACRQRSPEGNRQDVDCNHQAAEGCPAAECDADGDGFVGEDKASQPACAGFVVKDCDDADFTIFLDAPDKCGDGILQNCFADYACTTDADGDGYDINTDCDDQDKDVHPWATERCNQIDDDCDGMVDEGNPDQEGNPLIETVDGGGGTRIRSCNDSNLGLCKGDSPSYRGDCVCSRQTAGPFFTHDDRAACPGETEAVDNSGAVAARCYFAEQPAHSEKCNGYDDLCVGSLSADERDEDDDLYLACGADATTHLCGKPFRVGLLGCGDCDDHEAALHPNAEEMCNAVHDDCETRCHPQSPAWPEPPMCRGPGHDEGADDCGQEGHHPDEPTCCPGGTPDPANHCVNTTNDVDNCGGCAAVCSGGSHVAAYACQSSQCHIAACQDGYLNCSGDTLDLDACNCVSETHECSGQACLKKDGQPCSGDDAECAHGHCVNSMCCNEACGGGCQACSVTEGADSDGVCKTFAAGTHREACDFYLCRGEAGCPSGCSSADVGEKCWTNYCSQSACAACATAAECASTGQGFKCLSSEGAMRCLADSCGSVGSITNGCSCTAADGCLSNFCSSSVCADCGASVDCLPMGSGYRCNTSATPKSCLAECGSAGSYPNDCTCDAYSDCDSGVCTGDLCVSCNGDTQLCQNPGVNYCHATRCEACPGSERPLTCNCDAYTDCANNDTTTYCAGTDRCTACSLSPNKELTCRCSSTSECAGAVTDNYCDPGAQRCASCGSSPHPNECGCTGPGNCQSGYCNDDPQRKCAACPDSTACAAIGSGYQCSGGTCQQCSGGTIFPNGCTCSGGTDCASGYCDGDISLCAACTSTLQCADPYDGSRCDSGVCAVCSSSPDREIGCSCTSSDECGGAGTAYCDVGGVPSLCTACPAIGLLPTGCYCDTPTDCASGVCTDSRCVPCSSNGDCADLGAGYKCQNGSCWTDACGVPGAVANDCSCQQASDCASGYCSNDGTCAACTDDSQCGSGNYCNGGTCEACGATNRPNGCGCSQADDCASGYCAGSPSVCTSCTDSSQCGANEYCDGGTCTDCAGASLPNHCACGDSAECASNYCAGSICSSCDGPADCFSVGLVGTQCVDGACELCTPPYAAGCTCDDDGDCDGGLVCDTATTHACVAAECATAADCFPSHGSGQTCEGGFCVNSCLAPPYDDGCTCLESIECIVGVCGPDHVCAP